MAEDISARRRWGRRVRRAWRVMKWTAAVALLVAVVVIVWVNVSGEAARRDVLAEMKGRGLATEFPLPFSDQDVETPASDGTHFAKAALALSMLPDAQLEGVPVVSVTDGPPRGAAVPDPMATRLGRFAEDTAAFRTMLQRVREHEHFDYDMRWWEMDGPWFPRLGELRSAARTVQVLSLHEQANGQADEALDLYEQLLHLNDSFAQESWSVMLLVRISVAALTYNGLELALSRTTPSDEAISRVQSALADHLDSIQPARMAESELRLLADQLRDMDAHMAQRIYAAREYTANMKQYLRKHGPPMLRLPLSVVDDVTLPTDWEWVDALGIDWWPTRITIAEVGYLVCPGYWKKRKADSLRQYLDLYEELKKASGDAQKIAALGAVDRDDEAGRVETLRAILRTTMQWRAAMEATIAALEVERFRLAHGRWPNSLTELQRDVPDDPYSGGPLLYRKLSDGVVVYSVGINGVDDGGEQEEIFDRDADIAFRLYDPQVRGTLPMPAPPSETEDEMMWDEDFNPYDG